jgi:hypothetical protein
MNQTIDPECDFYDKENVLKIDSTDEEIEDDLINIRKEIYPRKMLVYISNVELNPLLELCTKLDIPFFNHEDPTGKLLFQKMEGIINDPIRYIYQTYYVSDDRNKKNGFHGFGDFIRGTIFLHQYFEQGSSELSLKVNFSNHLLSDIFVCDNHLSNDECENTKYIFDNNFSDIIEYKTIFTNNFEIGVIDKWCKEFIIKKCLTPRVHFLNKLTKTKATMNLSDYSVIHIRLHDDEKFNQERLNKIISIINKIQYRIQSKEILLIANNDIYLSRINIPNIIYSNLKKCHVGLKNSKDEIEDTMTEFMLMTTSNEIHQLSVYSWGSGFSDTVHKIYDVPLMKYSIS